MARKSLQYVAASLSKPYDLVCSWEKGEASPEPHDLYDLCLLFGISADNLIFGRIGTPSQITAAVIHKAQGQARNVGSD